MPSPHPPLPSSFFIFLMGSGAPPWKCLEDLCLFHPLSKTGQDKGPRSKAAGKSQGAVPSVLIEVREHGPHQCFTTARSFLLIFSKVSPGIRDLHLSGAFLVLTAPTFLLEPPGAAGSNRAGGGITSWDGLMSVPFLCLRHWQKCFQKH